MIQDNRTKLKIRYFDRGENKMVQIELDTDVVGINIPEQKDEHLPQLTVTVNTDAIIVDDQDGNKLAMYEFNEIVAEQ